MAATGIRTAVMAQNSGFGNMLNPLTSLLMPYEIPALLLLSMRGWPDPATDEPQHAVMGGSCEEILDVLRLRFWRLPADAEAGLLDDILTLAGRELDRGRCATVLVGRGAIGAPEAPAPVPGTTLPTRTDILRRILPRLRGLPIVSTTGYTSRDLFALGDADNHFYMQGAMGHASAFGLGLAIGRPIDEPVVVLDGDGAMLMHLGTVSTIGAAAPVPLVHVVFDNGCYESTGGQPTSAPTTDIAAVASACGYASARLVRSSGIVQALDEALQTPAPTCSWSRWPELSPHRHPGPAHDSNWPRSTRGSPRRRTSAEAASPKRQPCRAAALRTPTRDRSAGNPRGRCCGTDWQMIEDLAIATYLSGRAAAKVRRG
jgi:phosphonopyruvate decarboxylase